MDSPKWFLSWTRELAENHSSLVSFLKEFLTQNNWPGTTSRLKEDYQSYMRHPDRIGPLPSTFMFLIVQMGLIGRSFDQILWRAPHPLSKLQPRYATGQYRRWTKLSQKFCSACGKHFSTEEQLQEHNVSTHNDLPLSHPSRLCCKLCNLSFNQHSDMLFHESSAAHLSRLVANSLTVDRPKSEANKGKIVVEMPDCMKNQTPMRKMELGQEKVLNISIRNTGTKVRQITSCRILPWDTRDISLKWTDRSGGWTTEDLVTTRVGLVFPPSRTTKISVKVSPRSVGELRAVLVLTFREFRIARYLELSVEDETVRSMAPSAPFEESTPTWSKNSFAEQIIVSGERPNADHWRRYTQPLPKYDVPQKFRQQVERMDTKGALAALKQGLTYETYKDFFTCLLNFEEIQQEVDIESYNMSAATMMAVHQYYVLDVPGLSENRPSLIKGDAILAKIPGKAVTYKGFVHQVGLGEVHLKFHPSFKLLKNQQCQIQFCLNRRLLRRSKHAVVLAAKFLSPSVLIPFSVPPSLQSYGLLPSLAPLPALKPMRWQLNLEQQEAVQNILYRTRLLAQGGSGSARNFPPYLIFGPPGTGKTTTVVECMWQILRQFPGAKLLACAPSNNAADNIVRRMSDVLQKRHLLRVMAYTRQKKAVRSDILQYCRYDSEQDAFPCPDLDEILQAQVVVTTCYSSVLIASADVPRGHFTHIFVDEAGHAPEPEGILPAASLLGEKGTLVLAGDPHQLGPIIRSRFACKYGLQVSFLQRLIALPLYDAYPKEHAGEYMGFNPTLVTKLVKNYRSHPAILKVSSELFYEGELEACAEIMQRESLCSWRELPNVNQFPLLFHGVLGKDEREGNSPSFFNAAEASEVKRYIVKLRDTRGLRIDLTDIAVISPYRKQVEKLRAIFKGSGMGSVRVGSVEEFQGQESRVIIISTVRSSEEFLPYDVKHQLGFLSNPKRFNVAITRAKQLLIVVGNPHLLTKDKYWGTFIKYCVENNAYIGCSLPPFSISTPSEKGGGAEGITKMLERLNLGFSEPSDTVIESGLDFSMLSKIEHPEWPDATH